MSEASSSDGRSQDSSDRTNEIFGGPGWDTRDNSEAEDFIGAKVVPLPAQAARPRRPELSEAHAAHLTAEGSSADILPGRAVTAARGIAIKWPKYEGGYTAYLYFPPDRREPDGPKGLWAMGASNVELHPGWFRAPAGTDVLVVEGVKQSLAALSWAPDDWGIVGIQGCRGLVGELSWAYGMDVMLAFDADRHRNPDVRAAADKAVNRLRTAGARTVALWDIPQTDGSKTGLDDYLKALPEDGRRDAIRGLSEGQQAVVKDPVKEILAKLLTPAQLKELPDPEPLIQGWLTKNTFVRINGEPNAGKSLVALDWAACVATGTPWMGCQVEQGTVLYVIAEGVEGFKKRVAAWERHYGKEMTGMYLYPEPLQVVERERTGQGRLGESRDWRALREVCQTLKPVLIVLDTQRRVTREAEENSNSEMGHVVDCIEELRRETRAVVKLVHHTPKGGEGGSGAGAVSAAVNSEFMMTKRGHGLEAAFTLENTKEKDEADGTRLSLVLRVHQVGGDPDNPFCGELPATSVVLAQPDVSDAPRDLGGEVDLSVPAGTPKKDALGLLLERVWGGGGRFTKAEAKGLAVDKAKAMERQTFYKNWIILEDTGVIQSVLSDTGRETSKYVVSRPGDR